MAKAEIRSQVQGGAPDGGVVHLAGKPDSRPTGPGGSSLGREAARGVPTLPGASTRPEVRYPIGDPQTFIHVATTSDRLFTDAGVLAAVGESLPELQADDIADRLDPSGTRAAAKHNAGVFREVEENQGKYNKAAGIAAEVAGGMGRRLVDGAAQHGPAVERVKQELDDIDLLTGFVNAHPSWEDARPARDVVDQVAYEDRVLSELPEQSSRLREALAELEAAESVKPTEPVAAESHISLYGAMRRWEILGKEDPDGLVGGVLEELDALNSDAGVYKRAELMERLSVGPDQLSEAIRGAREVLQHHGKDIRLIRNGKKKDEYGLVIEDVPPDAGRVIVIGEHVVHEKGVFTLPEHQARVLRQLDFGPQTEGFTLLGVHAEEVAKSLSEKRVADYGALEEAELGLQQAFMAHTGEPVVQRWVDSQFGDFFAAEGVDLGAINNFAAPRERQLVGIQALLRNPAGIIDYYRDKTGKNITNEHVWNSIGTAIMHVINRGRAGIASKESPHVGIKSERALYLELEDMLTAERLRRTSIPEALMMRRLAARLDVDPTTESLLKFTSSIRIDADHVGDLIKKARWSMESGEPVDPKVLAALYGKTDVMKGK